MNRTFSLDGIAVDPGSRYQGWLPFYELNDGSALKLPIQVIHGSAPGDIVYVGAGAHGDEINTVLAAIEASRAIDPANVAGTIIFVPVENPYGFRHRRRLFDLNQSDSETLNLHRNFPGDPEGDGHQRMAHALYQLMKRSGATFIFDLHTGTTGSYCPPHAFVPEASLGAVANTALEAAKVFNTGLIVQASEGVYAHGGMPHTVLAREGTPVLGVELGQGGFVDDRLVALGREGILNVLRHRGVLNDGVTAAPVEQPIIKQVHYVRANRGGLIAVVRSPGEYLSKDDTIAEITNLYGDTVENVTAPVDGYLITTTPVPTTHSGERVCRIGSI